jgi:hypothetical protein
MRHTKACAGLSLIVGAVLLAACGGDSGTTPTVVATPAPPPPPVTTIIAQGAFTGLESRYLAFLPVSVTATGRLEVTVDWTFASNDIDIYVTQGTDPCTVQQFNTGTCPFLAFSESTSAKPERVTIASVAAGPHTLYIANFGSSEEAVSYQILLTTGGTSSARATAAVAHTPTKGSFLRMAPAR